jgi:hypothetical protein
MSRVVRSSLVRLSGTTAGASRGAAAARKSRSPKMSGFLSSTRAPAVTGASELMTIAAGS